MAYIRFINHGSKTPLKKKTKILLKTLLYKRWTLYLSLFLNLFLLLLKEVS